jgi:hypothetical protein
MKRQQPLNVHDPHEIQRLLHHLAQPGASPAAD